MSELSTLATSLVDAFAGTRATRAAALRRRGAAPGFRRRAQVRGRPRHSEPASADARIAANVEISKHA